MTLTVFSFATSLLLGSGALVLVHILRRNVFFLKGFGCRAVVLGYALCVLRMVFPVEPGFSRNITGGGVISDFYDRFFIEPVSGYDVSWFEVFRAVWAGGFCVALFVFIIQYARGLYRVHRYSLAVSPHLRNILFGIQAEYPRKLRAGVFICPGIPGPMGVGIISKRILLPPGEFSDRQLYHMIKHEYTHFYNRDLLVKFLVMLFCCIFWWNPLVYMLRKDVSQLLEVKCDRAATKGYSPAEITEYLSVIIDLLRRSGSAPPSSVAMGLVQGWRDHAMVERFDIMLSPGKGATRHARAAVAAVFLAVFALSYTVVIQPQYDPPAEEVRSEDGTIDPSLTGYIIHTPSGEYFMCSPGEDPWPIKKDTAEVFASAGIEIKEETGNENETD